MPAEGTDRQHLARHYLVAGADVLLAPVDVHAGGDVRRLLLQRDHQVQRLVVKACATRVCRARSAARRGEGGRADVIVTGKRR